MKQIKHVRLKAVRLFIAHQVTKTCCCFIKKYCYYNSKNIPDYQVGVYITALPCRISNTINKLLYEIHKYQWEYASDNRDKDVGCSPAWSAFPYELYCS